MPDCLPISTANAWWVNSDGKGNRHHNCLPDDAFWGFGAGFQIGLGIPSMNLVMVRYGDDPVEIKKATQKKLWPSEKLRDLTTSRVIFSPLNNSITVHLPPYPPSKKITSCTWDHINKVRRFAGGGSFRDGSDNWPITWANDNNLYTAYGDGDGFPPYIPNKLGMGFVKIEGNSENFTAINIRSDAENTSYGPTGKKASGMLSINKTLYILARNDNKNGKYSRLGWTTDHTRTFQWCKWNFKEFGHPTFINFGKNYEGARDKFVYIWSNNHPSAYEPSDHFVLARVPKSQILDRHCYEFFVTLRDKNPVWSKDINKRGPVFKFPGNCMRSSSSYNKGLKRYILWQNIRTSATVDTRYKGGFGIFEAPQPWGKWRTIFFTNEWDIGPGELGCFPTKWMKKDGKSMTIVCSSDDQFTVRKVILAVR